MKIRIVFILWLTITTSSYAGVIQTDPITPGAILGGFGTSAVYRGQTFRIPPGTNVLATRLSLFLDSANGGEFHLLLTEIDPISRHPSTIFFESQTMTLPDTSGRVEKVGFDLGGISLAPGDYTWILDHFVVGDPNVYVSISNETGDYQNGYGHTFHNGPFFPQGTREDHFNLMDLPPEDPYPSVSVDYAFQLEYITIFDWYENFDSEPIDFMESPYFSIFEGRLHFIGDKKSAGPEGVTWNGGDAPGGGWPEPADSNYFENFVVSVDTFWGGRSESYAYGVYTSVVGADESKVPRSNVTLSINKEGEYIVTKKKDDIVATVVGWNDSSLLSDDGQNNNLSVKKVGPYFYFYIDEVEVERRMIEGFHGGAVGLYSYHKLDASFDNFAISSASYNDFEEDSNNVLENFDLGVGGFSESRYFSLFDDRYKFLGDRTSGTYFHVWNGGFTPGGWSAESNDSNYFENFTVSVDTYWEEGSLTHSYGLIVCTTESTIGTSDRIRFWITQDGFYEIIKVQDNIYDVLVDLTASTLIAPSGAINKLSVQKDGNLYRFFINETEVQSLIINDFAGGSLGVEASQQLDVSFDNFTITQPGIPPIANAGVAQSVIEGDIVSLNGSGSSDDTAIASYRWTQLQGPVVSIINPTTSNPTFAAPDLTIPTTTLAFQLKVTDGDRLHDSGITLVEVACIEVTGDVNRDCSVNLKDAIIALQVVTGKDQAEIRSDYLSSGTDVSGDNKVGTEEAVNALKEEAGL